MNRVPIIILSILLLHGCNSGFQTDHDSSTDSIGSIGVVIVTVVAEDDSMGYPYLVYKHIPTGRSYEIRSELFDPKNNYYLDENKYGLVNAVFLPGGEFVYEGYNYTKDDASATPRRDHAFSSFYVFPGKAEYLGEILFADEGIKVSDQWDRDQKIAETKILFLSNFSLEKSILNDLTDENIHP